MLVIAGVIPIKDFPLTRITFSADDELINLPGLKIPCQMGTLAMIASAFKVTKHYNFSPPVFIFAGDIGEGRGSQQIYQYLIDNLAQLKAKVLVLHYLMPVITLMKKVCQSAKKCSSLPILIADAGSMYAAKAGGIANQFDWFTPDLTEISFLADKDATHPAYLKRHIFDRGNRDVVSLINDAYKHQSAAKNMLVKGNIDYIVSAGDIVASVSDPDLPAMECIGGTGDTITGLLAGLVYCGVDLVKAAHLAARINRLAGQYAGVCANTPVKDIINKFPLVLQEYASFA
jgi:hypothetical protein